MATIGCPPKYKTVEELTAAGEAYFEECRKNDEPITVTGLCLALGFNSREALLNYQGKAAFNNAVKRLKLVCQNYAEKHIYKGNPAGPIFSLKNFGWSDRQDLLAAAAAGGSPIELKVKVEFSGVQPNEPAKSEN